VPDPQDEATFRRSKLDLDERRTHRGVYRLYRELLALRRSDETLRRQTRIGLRAGALGDRALCFSVGQGRARRLVVANFGPAAEVALPGAGGAWRALFRSEDRRYGGSGAKAELVGGVARMPAESTVLFEPAAVSRAAAGSATKVARQSQTSSHV
jgi:maltooligosyltrehalose trehalohydrolase